MSEILEKWQHEGARVEQRLRTSAPAAHVWSALTTPEGLASWFVDAAEGKPVAGGALAWTWEDFGTFRYDVLAADPDRWLVLRPQLPGPAAQLIEIRIESERGATLVRLVHSGFGAGDAEDEVREGVASGWTLALALLRESLERYPGEARTGFLLMADVDGLGEGYANLRPFYRDETLLARWLTVDGELGEVGDAVRLRLRNDAPLSGEVLARSGWEVAVRWEEQRGVLELKAFRAGSGARVASLRFSAWGRERAELASVEETLRDCLARLPAAVSV
jgi:uncharacterized protein YndB with AHSA1/START domain